MNSETLIKIENIILQRGGSTVLDIRELQVRQGRILALIGPNGAGKSTLLLMLAGLLKPRQGKVYFQGRPVESRIDMAMLLAERKTYAFTFSGLHPCSWCASFRNVS